MAVHMLESPLVRLLLIHSELFQVVLVVPSWNLKPWASETPEQIFPHSGNIGNSLGLV